MFWDHQSSVLRNFQFSVFCSQHSQSSNTRSVFIQPHKSNFTPPHLFWLMFQLLTEKIDRYFSFCNQASFASPAPPPQKKVLNFSSFWCSRSNRRRPRRLGIRACVLVLSQKQHAFQWAGCHNLSLFATFHTVQHGSAALWDAGCESGRPQFVTCLAGGAVSDSRFKLR